MGMQVAGSMLLPSRWWLMLAAFALLKAGRMEALRCMRVGAAPPHQHRTPPPPPTTTTTTTNRAGQCQRGHPHAGGARPDPRGAV